MRDEPVDWGKLAPLVLHSMQVAILEAMRWIDEPFSAVDLNRMHNNPPGVPAIAYHLRTLAFDLPVLRLYREEAIRRSVRKLYFFRKRTPSSRRRKQAA